MVIFSLLFYTISMTFSDILALRLYNQKLTSSSFTMPHEVVRWLGAVQAQDLSASLYAIGLRLPGSTEASIEAAIADKSIIRSWPMRSTIHHMPAEDALWMTRLLGPRTNTKSASIFRNFGLTPEILTQAWPIIERTLHDGPKTRSDIYAALNAAGIASDESRGMHILKYWGQEALLCIGPRQGKQPTFALLESWIEHHASPSDEEAWATLARRYFMSHGPATLKDFTWWTGATKTEATKAFDAVRKEFRIETMDGQEYILPPYDTLPSLDPTRAFLLPAFDEYTVAYADRTAVMDKEDLKTVYNGIAANIIIGGRGLGIWKRAVKSKTVSIQLFPFRPLTKDQLTLLQPAATHYGEFVGFDARIN